MKTAIYLGLTVLVSVLASVFFAAAFDAAQHGQWVSAGIAMTIGMKLVRA